MKKKNNEIKILQVLMNNGIPRFIEYRSVIDGKDAIIDAQRFSDIFGWSMDELDAFSGQRNQGGQND